MSLEKKVGVCNHSNNAETSVHTCTIQTKASWHRIRKGGHHSDPCTSTIINLLCNPLTHSFSSPAP
jgi:hypothetical protein